MGRASRIPAGSIKQIGRMPGAGRLPGIVMRRMPLIACVYLLLLAACQEAVPAAGTPTPVAAIEGGERAARVDALFADYDRDDAPGVAVLVAHKGEVLFKSGYGMAEIAQGQPVEPNSAFRLASVSKQLTAMAVMILAERGRLDLDDPMVKFLPELARFGEGITIRHLLHHTSGMPDYYDEMLERDWEAPPTNRDVLALLAGWGELEFEPGEQFEYSNAGYDLLGSIVERAADKTYGAFLREAIFEPLGMKATLVYDDTALEVPNRAYGYSPTGREFEPDDFHILNLILGADGVYSTVEDLYLWDQALYTDRLVSREMLEEAFRSGRLDDGSNTGYGFGWVLDSYEGMQVMTHTGAWVGFSNAIARFPEQRFTVIVLSNRSDFEAEDAAFQIADIYIDELVENLNRRREPVLKRVSAKIRVIPRFQGMSSVGGR